jgi:hypothetical protein
MHVVAKPNDNPNGYRVFELPREQEAFDAVAHDLGLFRQGRRRWKNIDSRRSVRLHFALDVPSHLRGGSLHRLVDRGAPTERSIDLWPPNQRAIRIIVSAGGECVLPELWSSAVITVVDGFIRGGQAPAQMRPIGVALELDEGLAHLAGDPGPEAA